MIKSQTQNNLSRQNPTSQTQNNLSRQNPTSQTQNNLFRQSPTKLFCPDIEANTTTKYPPGFLPSLTPSASATTSETLSSQKSKALIDNDSFDDELDSECCPIDDDTSTTAIDDTDDYDTNGKTSPAKYGQFLRLRSPLTAEQMNHALQSSSPLPALNQSKQAWMTPVEKTKPKRRERYGLTPSPALDPSRIFSSSRSSSRGSLPPVSPVPPIHGSHSTSLLNTLNLQYKVLELADAPSEQLDSLNI